MDLKKVGIIAGKFKPPHKGHFETISKIASENDDISVFVSPVEMDGITGNAAVKILKHFFKDQPNVGIYLADDSPVREAFVYVSFLGKTEEAKNTVLTVYALESDMKRFDTIEKVQGDIVHIDRVVTSRPEGISGSNMRKYKNENDREKFNAGLPDSADKDIVWDSLSEDSPGEFAVPADSFDAAAKMDDPNIQPSTITGITGGIPNHWGNPNPMSRWDFMTNPIINIRGRNPETVKKNHVKSFDEYISEQPNK